jgi:hypothetical protein
MKQKSSKRSPGRATPTAGKHLHLKRFLQSIRLIAQRSGFSLRQHTDPVAADIISASAPSFPGWIRLEFDEESVASVGVVRTVGLPGDRSDYHDLISLIWAGCLRALNIASVRIIDVPHPELPGELWGRYILFDGQPFAMPVTLSRPDYDLIEKILTGSRLAFQTFSIVYLACDGDPDKENCDGPGAEAWVMNINEALRLKAKESEELSNHRQNPTWRYFRRNDRRIVAFHLSVNLVELLPIDSPRRSWKCVESLKGYLMTSGNIQNVIPKRLVKALGRLAQVYGFIPKKSLMAYLARGDVLTIVPTESHLICFARKGIFAFECESGRHGFMIERSLLLERHLTESEILFSSVGCRWASELDGDRFESLILDLLNREPGVQWARKVGCSSAADAERDILALWLLGPSRGEQPSEKRAMVPKIIVVQVKAYQTAINLSKVPDVPKILDLHAADGYLLVAFPRVTPQVVDYMTRVPQQRRFWADWWTQAEIEERLRTSLDVVKRYPDLVSLQP